MSPASALYVGQVFHRRVRPREHRLSYRAFWFLLDLDELPALERRLRLFSLNRANLFSFHDRDHGSGAEEPVRAQVERHLAAAGLDLRGGAIRLLCMPRILGYVFNPLSVYFCHHADGHLAALLYQVHNTFGERHSYLIPVAADEKRPIVQRCDKAFYVSPFMEMTMSYGFTVTEPGETVAVAIRADDAQGPMLNASLSAARRPLTDAALARLLFTHPLLTLKVIGAIHLEAVRIWWKGVGLRTRPQPPSHPVTLVRNGRD